MAFKEELMNGNNGLTIKYTSPEEITKDSYMIHTEKE